MDNTPNQKVTVSLPATVLSYADRYKEAHGMNRSEVLTLALKLLREKELIEGYRAMSEDESQQADPWLDSDLHETLKRIDRG